MAYETLLIEKEGSVAIVKINRPPVNSLNTTAYSELYDAFCQLEKDESVNAILLTGAGEKAFAAGLDIKDVAGKSIPKYSEFARTSRMTVDKVASVDKPTVAAVFGFTFGGGCELALACDLRIAAADASIGCPEVNLGHHTRVRRHSAAHQAGRHDQSKGDAPPWRRGERRRGLPDRPCQ